MAPEPDSGVIGQLLTNIQKDVSDTKTDVAVIRERLKPIDDHEKRLRALERWRYGLPLSFLLALTSSVLAAYGWLHH